MTKTRLRNFKSPELHKRKVNSCSVPGNSSDICVFAKYDQADIRLFVKSIFVKLMFDNNGEVETIPKEVKSWHLTTQRTRQGTQVIIAARTC